MKKKLIALSLSLILVLSLLAGCNNKKDDSTDAGDVTSPGVEDTASPEAPKEVNLEEFYDEMIEKHKVEAMLEKFEGDIVEQYFAGLAEIPAKQVVIHGSLITMNTTEFAFVEVENADDVETVKEIFQARIDGMVGTDDAPGGAWYPNAIEAWKNNSAVVSHGNYVAMIVCEQYESIVADFDALFE